MSEAKIAAKEPAVQTLETGTYYWCSCGLSKNQPFCDGSHEGSDFKPVAFEITETKQVALCQCKRTATPPFCDGKHMDL
jgi:CDGSH-type Zn-finger protein